jgi:hypothetical protein
VRGCDGTPVTVVTRPPREGPTRRYRMPLKSAGSTASIIAAFAAGRAGGDVTPCTGRVGDRTGCVGGRDGGWAWSSANPMVPNRLRAKIARRSMATLYYRSPRRGADPILR